MRLANKLIAIYLFHAISLLDFTMSWLWSLAPSSICFCTASHVNCRYRPYCYLILVFPSLISYKSHWLKYSPGFFLLDLHGDTLENSGLGCSLLATLPWCSIIHRQLIFKNPSFCVSPKFLSQDEGK